MGIEIMRCDILSVNHSLLTSIECCHICRPVYSSALCKHIISGVHGAIAVSLAHETLLSACIRAVIKAQGLPSWVWRAQSRPTTDQHIADALFPEADAAWLRERIGGVFSSFSTALPQAPPRLRVPLGDGAVDGAWRLSVLPGLGRLPAGPSPPVLPLHHRPRRDGRPLACCRVLGRRPRRPAPHRRFRHTRLSPPEPPPPPPRAASPRAGATRPFGAGTAGIATAACGERPAERASESRGFPFRLSATFARGQVCVPAGR